MMALAPAVARRIAELRRDLGVPITLMVVLPDGSALVFIPDAAAVLDL